MVEDAEGVCGVLSFGYDFLKPSSVNFLSISSTYLFVLIFVLIFPFPLLFLLLFAICHPSNARASDVLAEQASPSPL